MFRTALCTDVYNDYVQGIAKIKTHKNRLRKQFPRQRRIHYQRHVILCWRSAIGNIQTSRNG